MIDDDLLAAKRVLDTGYTCVLCYKGMVFTSKKEGILPLVEFLDSKCDFKMFSICKKEINECSAILLVKFGINNISTYSLTKKAKNIFDNYGILCKYNELVDETSDKFDNLLTDITNIDLAIQKINDEIKK